MNDHLKYRADIDGLRAIAVLLVVLFHAFPEWFRGGFVGVDVFFVISGYLITNILLRSHAHGTYSLLEFYERRVRRIFPALLLVIASTLIAAWFLLLPSELAQIGKHALAGLGFVANLVYWNEAGYFDTDANQKPLLHLWSLGVEEQFYLFFPLFVYLCIKRKGSPLHWFTWTALASFAVGLTLTWTHPSAAYYLPFSRAWELMLGAVIAALPHQHVPLANQPRLRKSLGLLSLILLMAGCFLITEKSRFPGFWALIPVTGAALAIWLGKDRHEILGRFLCHRRLVAIGLISYPFYLWHWPLLTFARMWEGDEPSRRARFLLVLAAALLSWMTYVFLEKPIRTRARKHAAIPALIAASLASTAIALTVFINHGFPARFPETMPGLSDFQYDAASRYRRGQCFLDVDQGPADFAPSCFDQQPELPTVVVWGDSHAAQLYPGLLAVYAGQANIIQLTATRCPPIPGLDVHNRPLCRAVNDAVVSHVTRIKPDLLLLAGAWHKYEWQNVQETVKTFVGQGIPQVVVVGPVPKWKEDLPKMLYRAMRQDSDNRLPYAMSAEAVQGDEQIEAGLRSLVTQAGGTLVSARAALCEENDRCLVRTGQQTEHILYWDTNHLTDEGSRLVIGTLAQEKLPAPFHRNMQELRGDALETLQRLKHLHSPSP